MENYGKNICVVADFTSKLVENLKFVHDVMMGF
jgi:hypothetical protein